VGKHYTSDCTKAEALQKPRCPTYLRGVPITFYTKPADVATPDVVTTLSDPQPTLRLKGGTLHQEEADADDAERLEREQASVMPTLLPLPPPEFWENEVLPEYLATQARLRDAAVKEIIARAEAELLLLRDRCASPSRGIVPCTGKDDWRYDDCRYDDCRYDDCRYGNRRKNERRQDDRRQDERRQDERRCREYRLC
jgi:hypothetical protein